LVVEEGIPKFSAEVEPNCPWKMTRGEHAQVTPCRWAIEWHTDNSMDDVEDLSLGNEGSSHVLNAKRHQEPKVLPLTW
jgi:hypothetical protein